MRYSVPILALALTAVADPTATLKKAAAVKRGLPEITSVLAQVSDLTLKLDTAVNAYTSDFSAVQSASDAINAAVKSGIAKVSGGQLDLNGALGVQAPVQELTKTVEKTVDDTISKKSAFASNGKGGDVYKSFVDQKAGADELSKTISSQVPQELQGVAAALSAGISTALQKGIDAFKEFEGTASSGSSSSGSSSGGAASGGAASGGSSSSGSSSSGGKTPSAGSSGSSGSSSSGSTSGSTGTSSGSGSASRGGAATTSAPAQFTGAGSVNSFSVVGVLAAVAAVLAF